MVWLRLLSRASAAAVACQVGLSGEVEAQSYSRVTAGETNEF